MKPSWPEFPKGKDSNVTTPEEGKQVEDVVVAEIDYEDQHLQSAALLKEMLSRKELVEGFAREELGIYL
jgi:hypothetical protein